MIMVHKDVLQAVAELYVFGPGDGVWGHKTLAPIPLLEITTAGMNCGFGHEIRRTSVPERRRLQGYTVRKNELNPLEGWFPPGARL